MIGNYLKYRRIWNEELEKINASPEERKRFSGYYDVWVSSQREGRSTMTDEMPWLTYEAIDFLNRYVRKTMRVFEFGGGGSSVYFAKHAGHVITVEHDARWFEAMCTAIERKGITNWDGNLVTAVEGGTGEIGDPDAYLSGDEIFHGKNFKAYASFIDRYDDNSFDIIIVDGRARPSCTKHAIPKLKKGGWLIIDNSDREYYFTAFREILHTQFDQISNQKGPAPYCTWFTQTGIWKKK
jgi:predicted O-methyltransferase YrrM